MTFLAALRLAKKHRGKAPYAVILIFLGVLYAQEQKVERLEIALAAKPKVITKIKVKTETRVVKGPERVVEKIIEKPGGERIVARVVYRDRIVKETGTVKHDESERDPVVALAAVERRDKRWLVGAAVAPGALDLRVIRGGLTLKDRFDLTYAYEIYGPVENRHRLEFAVRF